MDASLSMTHEVSNWRPAIIKSIDWDGNTFHSGEPRKTPQGWEVPVPDAYFEDARNSERILPPP